MPEEKKPNSEAVLQTMEAFGYTIVKRHISTGIVLQADHHATSSQIKGFGKDVEAAATDLFQAYSNYHINAASIEERNAIEKRQLDHAMADAERVDREREED